MAVASLGFDLYARDRNVAKTFRGLRLGITATSKALGLLGAAGGISIFAKESIAEAREAQKVTATTTAIIKSTGGAAKVTTKHVGALSTALSNQAGIDDEIIQHGANLLLTFKKVRDETGKGNKIFDRATAAAVNLSAAGFGSIDSASKMLGKALNDPVKGLTALSRAGVTFTEGQKKQITQMVKTGDVLGAQKLILKEVESQVGGVAAASATAGEKASVAWKNFQEGIGTRVLPALDKIENAFATLLPKVLPFVDAVAKRLAPGLEKVVSAGGKVVAWARANQDVLVPLTAGILAGVAAWKAYVAVTKTIVAVTKAVEALRLAVFALQLAFATNPVGVVVVALVALGVALVVAYKKSEAFRNIVNKAFIIVQATVVGMGQVFLKFAKIALQVFKFLAQAGLDWAGMFIHAAALAFGWVPGIGPKLKGAAAAFDHFSAGVAHTFDDAIGKVNDWDNSLTKAQKVVSLKGNIVDLDHKLASARKQLKDPNLTKERRAKLNADIRELLRKKKQAQDAINALHGKTVTLRTVHETVLRTIGANTVPNSLRPRHRAAGGPVKANQAYIVGENRPEMFVPDSNGMIRPRVPAGASRRGAMSPSTSRSAGPMVLELRATGFGSGIDRLFLSWLQGALRSNPGVKLTTRS